MRTAKTLIRLGSYFWPKHHEDVVKMKLAQVSLLFLSCNNSYDCHIVRPTLKLFLFPFTKPYTIVSKREGLLVFLQLFGQSK